MGGDDEINQLQSHDMIELSQLLIQLPWLQILSLGCKLVPFCGLSRLDVLSVLFYEL